MMIIQEMRKGSCFLGSDCCSMWQLIQKMVGERSIEREFFSVLYQISAAKSTHPMLSNIVLAVYMLLLLLVYLSLADPQQMVAESVLGSLGVALSVGGMGVVIVLQLIVAFLYRIQVQLQLQLMVLRYILFPVGLLILVAQVQTEDYFSAQTAIGLITVFILITYFVNFIIHSYSGFNISRSFERVSSYLVLTDALLVLTRLPSQFVWVQTMVGTMIGLHLLMRHRLQRCNLSGTQQHLEYHSMLVKDLLAGLFLSQRALITGGDALLMMLLLVPLLGGALVRELSRRRGKVVGQEVFSGKAGVNELLQTMQAMGVELQRFKSNQDLQLQGSLLLVFVAVHGRACKNSGCLLLQRSTQEEIRNCSSSNNMKILKHKIIKKMEALFELYDRSLSNDSALKLARLAFYVAHLPNKTKITALIATIRAMPLCFQLRLMLYGLDYRMQGIEGGQQLGAAKGEEEFLQFKKLMVLTVGSFQEFWTELLQQRVDVSQLSGVSARLFPLKRALETAWRRHINRQQFSSWNVLRTYTYYRRNILRDYTNSVILEDYCKIVEQRLKGKHEMSYINTATEQAVLAISLTESSLGNLASMNSQTCKMFSFGSKAEMLELRVNDIMPGVYSEVHDNILSSFLKNRFKNINQDLRFVFGKNKNGFIFPFMLQLRKLSWNLNDELIFIAHLEHPRVRAAPIYCIADLEGDLQDYTSTFAWLFMKKARDNKQIKRRNIQELIPSFFETMEGHEGKGLRVNFHERSYSLKNGNNIQIEFSASELFIKAEKVGYLVEGTNTLSMMTFPDQRNISAIVSRLKQERSVFANIYSTKKLAYMIPNRCEQAQGKEPKEFTIPFLHTADIQGILRMNKEPPSYGKNIKTLRLWNGRMEHIVEEESFVSDEDNFEMKELSVIKKVEKMREQLALQRSRPGSVGPFRMALILGTLFLILPLLIALFTVPVFTHYQQGRFAQMELRLQVRQLLPQLLIYTAYGLDGARSLREELKNNLLNSKIAEDHKQEIMRVMFAGVGGKVADLDGDVLEWDWGNKEKSQFLLMGWYWATAATFIFLIGLFGMYLVFRCKISDVYLVFLSVGEQKLHEMKQQTIKLLDFLSAQNTQYHKVAPLQQFRRQETEQAEFHRIKKLKDDFTIEDCTFLTHLLLPIILLFTYALTSSLLLQTALDNYQGKLGAWLDSSQLLPDSSLALMNFLLKPAKPITSNFFELQARYQFVALEGGEQQRKILQLIQGDPCGLFEEPIPDFILEYCKNVALSTFTNSSLNISLSNALNYMASVLRPEITSHVQPAMLISLEFRLLKPLLGYISKWVGKSVEEERLRCERLAVILGVVFLALLMVAALYIGCYPLAVLSERLLSTSDLVKLLPSAHQRQPEQALAAMTTEAMENY